MTPSRDDPIVGGHEGRVIERSPAVASGAGPSGQLVHAFGFSAHGFALVPLVGTLVADLLEGRKPAQALDAFAPDRFASAPNAGRGIGGRAGEGTGTRAGVEKDKPATKTEEAA